MTPQDLKQIGKLFDKKFDNIDKKFDNIDKKFDNIDKKFDNIDKKFDNIDKKFDNIDKRFNNVDKSFVEIKADIAVLKYKADKNEKAITKINNNILKWKSDMFDSAEKFMKETKDQREFRIIGGYQTTNNTDRIEKLEKTVFGVVSVV